MGTANRNPSSRLGRHSGPEVVFSLLDWDVKTKASEIVRDDGGFPFLHLSVPLFSGDAIADGVWSECVCRRTCIVHSLCS